MAVHPRRFRASYSPAWELKSLISSLFTFCYYGILSWRTPSAEFLSEWLLNSPAATWFWVQPSYPHKRIYSVPLLVL
jgi:hypothetical protein